MTRKRGVLIRCKHCGGWTETEEPFNRWVRGHPDLDSREAGLVLSDIDLTVHRYSHDEFPEYQFLMDIEVKTRAAKPRLSQRDTLLLRGQFLRNRRDSKHRRHFRQVVYAPNEAYSDLHKKDVKVRACGAHLLRLQGTTPDDSAWMYWDKHLISQEILIDLLLFRRDPDEPWSPPEDFIRKHHRSNPTPPLPSID